MNTVQRVYDLLEERHISLHKLSQLSGINYSTLKTTERRNGQLSVDTIERVCHAIGIPLYEFFRVDERTPHSSSE